VTVYCTQCGHRNPESSRFCARCGALTQALDDTTVTFGPTEVEVEVEEEVAWLPEETGEAGAAVLVVRRGPNAGSAFRLDKDVVTVGRHPESDIFLDDITVSRRHAEVRRQAGRYVIHDEGSLNGTYVNRERVDDANLASGDELQVGRFRLAFFMKPSSEPAGEG